MVVSVRARPLKYSHTVGMLALTGKGFSNPIDLALGGNGLVYVLNRSNSNQAPQGAVRVTICTLDEEYVGALAAHPTVASRANATSSFAFAASASASFSRVSSTTSSLARAIGSPNLCAWTRPA